MIRKPLDMNVVTMLEKKKKSDDLCTTSVALRRS